MSEADNGMTVEQEIYRLLTKTFYLMDDCDRHIFAEYGLSGRQFWALRHLDEKHGCSMVDLSRRVLTEKSNVTGIVDRLESLKLATRTPAAHDRRVILIKLTPEGAHLRDLLSQKYEARIQELMQIGEIGNTNLRTFHAYLNALSQKLEGYLEQLTRAPGIHTGHMLNG